MPNVIRASLLPPPPPPFVFQPSIFEQLRDNFDIAWHAKSNPPYHNAYCHIVYEVLTDCLQKAASQPEMYTKVFLAHYCNMVVEGMGLLEHNCLPTDQPVFTKGTSADSASVVHFLLRAVHSGQIPIGCFLVCKLVENFGSDILTISDTKGYTPAVDLLTYCIDVHDAFDEETDFTLDDCWQLIRTPGIFLCFVWFFMIPRC